MNGLASVVSHLKNRFGGEGNSPSNDSVEIGEDGIDEEILRRRTLNILKLMNEKKKIGLSGEDILSKLSSLIILDKLSLNFFTGKQGKKVYVSFERNSPFILYGIYYSVRDETLRLYIKDERKWYDIGKNFDKEMGYVIGRSGKGMDLTRTYVYGGKETMYKVPLEIKNSEVNSAVSRVEAIVLILRGYIYLVCFDNRSQRINFSDAPENTIQ